MAKQTLPVGILKQGEVGLLCLPKESHLMRLWTRNDI